METVASQLKHNTMSIKILIVGPAASGKTTLAKQLQAKGFNIGKLLTTRPKRDVSDEEYYFYQKLPPNRFVWCDFNGWKYALTNASLLKYDVFIVGPKMAQMIKDKAPEYKYLTIFLDVPESVRYQRLIQREMPGDTAIARIGRDRADFAHFTEYDIRIHENHEQQVDVILKALKHIKETPC